MREGETKTEEERKNEWRREKWRGRVGGRERARETGEKDDDTICQQFLLLYVCTYLNA